MKGKRLFLIMSFMLIIVLLFLISSSIFELKSVEMRFYNNWGSPISISENSVYNTQSKVKEAINSAKFDYGKLVFSINKREYLSRIESSNPYLKALSIESIFPNKLIVSAMERQRKFYIKSEKSNFILDGEFKILERSKDIENLAQIKFYSNGVESTFSDFFEISSLALEKGMFLRENNLVFDSCNNFYDILLNCEEDIFSSIESISFFKREGNIVDMKIFTYSPYGTSLEIKNIFEKFNYKLDKILSAYTTLCIKEKIKTTYGLLYIDESCNCHWQNT